MKRRNTDVPECAVELLSRFEFDQVHVYAKKFRKGTPARKKNSPELKERIARLRKNGGVAAHDAYTQLVELGAIGAELSSVKDVGPGYPKPLMKNMKCLERATWNISKKASREISKRRVSYAEVKKARDIIDQIDPNARGKVFCLRQDDHKNCHWVSLTEDWYTDDIFCAKTIDFSLASAILTCMQQPESTFGHDYRCRVPTIVRPYHFIRMDNAIIATYPDIAEDSVRGGSETGVACGTGGKVSALQSPYPLLPGAPLTDHTCNKNGRNRNKKRKVKKPRKKSSTTCKVNQNIQRAKTTEGGCRKVLNKTPAMIAPTGHNGRTCLADAIGALLPDKQSKQSIFSSICSEMPAEGDTSIACANVALARHGMVLERATSQYNQRGGLPYHLMKECECRLVINIKLGVIARKTLFASHFVAWDGKVVWDRPHSVKVNDTSDRTTIEGSRDVFGRLYHKKQFSSWQITNVYRLSLRS